MLAPPSGEILNKKLIYMRIAIDFREAVRKNRAGKGEYVYELVRAWLKIIDKNTQLILITYTGQSIDLPKGNWQQKTFMSGWRWHKWVWVWLEFMRPVDYYFATTSFIVPAFLRSVPVVTTIFDFTVWRHLYSQARVDTLERLTAPLACRFSRKLIAISKFTKQEAIELFNVPNSKIETIYLAAGEQYKPLKISEAEKQRLRKKYRLPEKFVLYLGTLEPRKNILSIIRAFKNVESELDGTELVLAGGWGWKADEIKQAINTHEIRTIGYVDYIDKPLVYNLASLFVFPSYYEGFGLPPLEAMACGTPTIVSNTASLPEVVGDASPVVSPNNVDKLAKIMKDVVNNTITSRRLHTLGIEQAKQFSWEKAARQTQEVFKK